MNKSNQRRGITM